MKNTNMIRFTRGAVLAGLVLGSSMAHAWKAPIQIKVQPTWLNKYGKTLAVSATGLGLASFVAASIYKYNTSKTTQRLGKLGYFGFVWDGAKGYFSTAKDSVVNGAKKVRRNHWRTDVEKVEDLTSENNALNEQLVKEKDASKNAELAKKLQPRIDANNKKIVALNDKIEAKAKADKEAAEAVAKKAAKAPVASSSSSSSSTSSAVGTSTSAKPA